MTTDTLTTPSDQGTPVGPSPRASVAELVSSTLAHLGAGHVFGVVGSGNFTLTNALREAGVPFTAARHEGGAATMADAYSRMSGRVGIVSTHQGCGLTNAVTGIGEAAKSRTPMIVLTADTATSAIRSNFRIDQDGLARSVGAVAERVFSPESAVADTTRAFRTAVNERRTVVLSVPTDLQAVMVETPATPPLPPALPSRVRPSVEGSERLAELLRSSERIVFVAGRGAREAGPEISVLAEACGALLSTSAVANGLFREDPFDLGISGGFSSPFTAATISEADLIVGWGCALNMWTMRHGSLIGRGATVVQVDLEDAGLGGHRPIDLGVQGDCAATASAVLELLNASRTRRSGLRTPQMAASIRAQARWNDAPIDDLSTDESIDPRVLSAELDKLLPPERIVSVDSGNFMGYPSAYLEVPDEFGFCFTQAFQSVGLGLATAIGAATARPDRLPVLGTGDGGFLMSISELETAVRQRIPLVTIVYNDSAYGAEVHHFQGDDKDLEIVRFPVTDIASIARGYGAEGLVVRRREDLAAVSGWLAGPRSTPLVIDARISSDGGAWWLAEAFKGH